MSSRIEIVPGDAMWPVFFSMSPSGTNLTIGAHSALPILRAIASQFACSTSLCLPVTSHGPFGSMPPVEMITLVLPALIASRTSIHVISSSHTVLAAGSGFGASTQL